MKNVPKMIVMLTHHDRTVEDAIEVFEAAKNSKANYWGCKEVGIPEDQMTDLVKRMKAAGKTTFLEVVDYTEEGCIAGAECGVRCGFDVLMGTKYFDSVHKIVKDAGMEYMPFVGRISGRPSTLEGTIQGMIDEANDLVDTKGIKSFDLLGYRYTGDAVKLNSEFVKNVRANVCLAGSVASFQRLDEVKATGAWAFTIGSAFFEHNFGEDKTFGEQIDIVIDYMNRKEAPLVVRKNEARTFYEGPELCREYYVTDKITFGSSTLQPGETGDIDPGHPASHEVFYVAKGNVTMFVKETGARFRLYEQDAILMPEGVSHTLVNDGNTEAVITWSKAPSEL